MTNDAGSSTDREVDTDREAEIVPLPDRCQPFSAPGHGPLFRDALGEVLREERQSQSRTLQEVADEAFVSVGHLSELERGLKEASSEVIDSVTRALDLEVADVLERTADRLRLRMGDVGTVLALAA